MFVLHMTGIRLGDCATIENPKMIDIVIKRFQKIGAQKLNYEEFCTV